MKTIIKLLFLAGKKRFVGPAAKGAHLLTVVATAATSAFDCSNHYQLLPSTITAANAKHLQPQITAAATATAAASATAAATATAVATPNSYYRSQQLLQP